MTSRAQHRGGHRRHAGFTLLFVALVCIQVAVVTAMLANEPGQWRGFWVGVCFAITVGFAVRHIHTPSHLTPVAGEGR